MSFASWKKSFSSDKICSNHRELKFWLSQHSVSLVESDWARIRNQKWICMQEGSHLYLKQYVLFLTIQGLTHSYTQQIFSLENPKDIIHNEYFQLFGNLCRILSQHSRIMEYPCSETTSIQKISLFAHVKPLWREERASFTINRFLKNCSHPDRFPNLRRVKTSTHPKLEKSYCSLSNMQKWYNDSFHDKIIQYFLKDNPQQLKQPRLVLIFGLPGSGKNWALEKKRETGHVQINVDDVRGMLPKYWKA